MCGIIGYLAKPTGKTDTAFNLDAGIQALHHRGPDEQGRWQHDSVGLGHTRLSIIDLNGGKQPMTGDQGRYTISFNGEIYNFLALRQDLESQGHSLRDKSDTAVLVKLIEIHGFEKTLPLIRGMFAIAVWDDKDQVLHIARDRMGVKPVVYAQTDKGVAFSSEIAPLFKLCPEMSKAPDYEAMDYFLSYQYIPSPMSGFKAIRKLPPAHAMTLKAGTIQRIWRYWDIDFSKRFDGDFNDACEAMRETLLEATRIRLESDVPLGAFLSGGIDSSIIVAAMQRLGAGPVKTFSIGFAEDKYNELPYAKQIAEHTHSDHHEEVLSPNIAELLPNIIRHLGEPMADNSALPTYAVAEYARRHVTVALTGDGPDEAFGGYRRFYHASLYDTLEGKGLLPLWRLGRRATVSLENLVKSGRPSFPASRGDQALSMTGAQRYKHLLAYFTDEDKRSLAKDEFFARSGSPDTSTFLKQWLDKSANADAINRYCYTDMNSFQAENVLAKVDITSMMHALECRSPFLDHQWIELAYTLPGHFKLAGRGKHKHILKEAFKDWLPDGFMTRGKMGFTLPLANWLRTDLAQALQDRLRDNAKLDTLFRSDTIHTLLDEHLSQKTTHTKRLWALYVLAEWMEQFNVDV